MADDILLDSLKTAHPAVGDLPVLLEKLRRLDRLVIGTERAQHAAALLQRLAAAGLRLDDPEAAASWLGPVLCVSARDRRALLERLLREATARHRRVAPPPRVVGAMPLEALEAAAQRAARRPWQLGLIIAAATIATVVGTLLALGGGGAVGPTPTEAGGMVIDWQSIAAALPVLAAVLVAIGLAVARRLLGPPPPIAVTPADPLPTGQGLAWLDEGALQAPLRLMGRLSRGAGRHLDLAETIRRTVKRAGWPTLVRGGRPRTPEHVLLVEVAGADDPRMLAAAAVLDRLRGADLRVTAFICAGGLATPRPWSGGPSMPLARVAALHRGARLLLVSDGDTLHDPFANRIVAPPAFDAFSVPVLVTPVARGTWSWREAAFDRAGWRLAELSTDGLVELARWLSGPREALPLLTPPGDDAVSFATLLARDARLFSDDAGLPAELRDRLVDRLALHLGADPLEGPGAFDLLRVLAMGASLTPATVERVAAHLASLDGPRAEEPALRRLLELPWFARGRLPTWLREDLLRGLPDELATKGRSAWLLHLAGQPIGKGALSREQVARLAAESRRAVAQSPQVDERMLRVLALEAPARDWRAWLKEGGLALAMAAGAAAGLGALAALGPTILALGARLFAPFAFATTMARPWLGMLAAALAGGLFVLRALGPPLNGRAMAIAVSSVALVLAIAPVWLFATPGPGAPPAQQAEAGSAAALAAVIGLIVLRFVVAAPKPSGVAAVFARGNPWWTVPMLYGLIFMSLGVNDDVPSPEPLASWAAREAAIATGAAMIAYGGHGRLKSLGQHAPASLMRAAIAFVAGQAVGGGIAEMLPPGGSGALGPMALFIRLLAGVVAVSATLGLPIRTRRVILTVCVAAVVGVVAIYSGGSGLVIGSYPLPSSWVAAFVVVPLPLIAVALLCPPPRRRLWLPLLLSAATSLALALTASVANLLANFVLGAPTIVLKVAASLPPYLLAWPLLRAMRPDLLPASDGLWWRCLLLVPCWLGVSIPLFAVGPFPLLAIPVAAWIAHRHGPRALPAIAFALAPMAFLADLGSGVMLRLGAGAGLGHLLAALLVARFVADRRFRLDCLGATTLRPRHLAALALLPLAYATPGIDGLRLTINLWPLAVTVAALIGLSRIELRAPLLALAGSTTIAFLLAFVIGSPAPPELGRFFHAMRNVPGDLITILLSLGLFRMLRGEPPAEAGRALLTALRDQPSAVAIAMAVIAFMTSATLAIQPWLSEPLENLSLLPFSTTHFILATIYWAAVGIDIPWNRRLAIRGGDRLPWPVALATMTAAASLMPAFRFDLGGLSLGLMGRSVAGAIGTVAAVWLFHRLGRSLARLVPVVPVVHAPAPETAADSGTKAAAKERG